MDIRETVIHNILTTSEVAEILQVSKQRIASLAKEGKLVPVKKDSQGMIFLRSDVYDYKNSKWKKDSGKIFAEFIGGIYTSINFYIENIDKLSDIHSIHVYFDRFDAIVNNYYMESDLFITQHIREIDCPHMIIKDVLGHEIWLSGCNCGYGGTGPHGTFAILKNLKDRGRLILDISDDDLKKLIIENRVINIFADNNNETASIIATKTAVNSWESQMSSGNLNASIYLYNSKPILLQNSRPVKESPEEFFNKFRAFVPQPVEILLYTDVEAARDAGYVVGSYKLMYKEDPYQMIIKDKSGRELWLQVKLNKWEAPENRPDIRKILSLCGFEVQAESPKLLGWLEKGMSLITGKQEQPIRFAAPEN